MSRNQIFIIGYFGYVNNQIDGQTIKTRNVYNLILSKNIKEVKFYDTQEFQYNKLTIFKMFIGIWKCSTLLYLPGQRNLKLLFPIIYYLCKIRNVDIINLAVGGWLNEFLLNNESFVEKFRKFSQIFVESKLLKSDLENSFQFRNVQVFPNFRVHNFNPIVRKLDTHIFKIVFFARVTKEKGIDLIFDYAKRKIKANKQQNLVIDFYGPIPENEKEEFFQKIVSTPITNYKGIVKPEIVFETLSKYDLLVLPSHYSGEGFPGTVIDAYISGLPVIVSDWKFLPEYVEDSKTGFVFKLAEPDSFFERIDTLRNNPELLKEMKANAGRKSKQYSSEVAWELLVKHLV